MAIPESIKKKANQVRNEVYGKDVREALASGIEEAGDIADQANTKSNDAVEQVDNIQAQVNQLVVEGDSSVEAAQARVDAEGKSYPTLKARLDAKETEFSSQLAQRAISTSSFPRLADEVDDIPRILRTIDYAKTNGVNRVIMPEHYFCGSVLEIKHSDIILDGLSVGVIETPLEITDSFMKISVVNKEKVVIKDLMINGNSSLRNLVDAEGGIEIVNSRYCTISNVTIKNVGKDIADTGGVHIYLLADESREGGHCEYNVVEGCTLLGGELCNFGIRPYTEWTEQTATKECRFNILRDNRLFGFMWNAIEVAGHLTKENVIENNIVKDSYVVGIEADKGASFNVFSNNIVENMKSLSSGQGSQGYRSQGVPSDGIHPTRVAKGNRFIGNIARNIAGTAESTCGFYLAYTEDISFLTNTVDNTRNGYSMMYEPCHSINFESNNLTNLENLAFYFRPNEKAEYKNIIITKNQIKNCSSMTSVFENSKDIIISDNIINVTRHNAIGLHGSVENPTHNIKIKDNILKAVGNFAFYITANTKDVLIDGNSVESVNGVRIEINDFIISNNNFEVENTLFSITSGNGLGVFENNKSNLASQFTRTRRVTHSPAMPTTGSWNKMDYVINMNASELGEEGNKYVIKGWLRMTDGANHVLNVDWVEDRMLTGN